MNSSANDELFQASRSRRRRPSPPRCRRDGTAARSAKAEALGHHTQRTLAALRSANASCGTARRPPSPVGSGRPSGSGGRPSPRTTATAPGGRAWRRRPRRRISSSSLSGEVARARHPGPEQGPPRKATEPDQPGPSRSRTGNQATAGQATPRMATTAGARDRVMRSVMPERARCDRRARSAIDPWWPSSPNRILRSGRKRC